MPRSNLASASPPRPVPVSARPPVRAQIPRPRSSAATKRERMRTSRRFIIVVAALLAAVCVLGLPYYTLSFAERVRSPLHPWLRPSGYIGQSAGLAAVTIFLFLWLYPIRKRARWLAWTGSIARCLGAEERAGGARARGSVAKSRALSRSTAPWRRGRGRA